MNTGEPKQNKTQTKTIMTPKNTVNTKTKTKQN